MTTEEKAARYDAVVAALTERVDHYRTLADKPLIPSLGLRHWEWKQRCAGIASEYARMLAQIEGE